MVRSDLCLLPRRQRRGREIRKAVVCRRPSPLPGFEFAAFASRCPPTGSRWWTREISTAKLPPASRSRSGGRAVLRRRNIDIPEEDVKANYCRRIFLRRGRFSIYQSAADAEVTPSGAVVLRSPGLAGGLCREVTKGTAIHLARVRLRRAACHHELRRQDGLTSGPNPAVPQAGRQARWTSVLDWRRSESRN